MAADPHVSRDGELVVLDVETDSVSATEALAERMGRAAYAGLVIALDGELGAGKTCFVRGFARGLGVAETISSPTFALQHVYVGRHELWHFDAWRAGPERALLADLGPAELSRDAVVLVEWAERVLDLLPLPRLEIRIEHAGADARRLRAVWREPSPPCTRRAHVGAWLAALDELAVDFAVDFRANHANAAEPSPTRSVGTPTSAEPAAQSPHAQSPHGSARPSEG